MKPSVPHRAVFVGLDIGGGSTKLGLVGSNGTLLDEIKVGYNPADTGDDIVGRYVKAIGEITDRNQVGAVDGIGVGYPGTICEDNRSGGLGNVSALIGFPLADRLEACVKVPVRLMNDASAAAVAEARFGGHRGAGRMLMVTVGTGIGLAFVVDGAAQATSGGGLGDAGHMIVETHDPRRCRLGCLGCLESVASGEAVNEMAARYARDNPDSAIARLADGRGKTASAAEVVQCCEQGDADAVAMLGPAATWLGRAVASWTHIFAPTAVIIGGGLSAAGPFFVDNIAQEARRCGLDAYLRDVQFAPALLGNRAGMIGAAAQMFDR